MAAYSWGGTLPTPDTDGFESAIRTWLTTVQSSATALDTEVETARGGEVDLNTRINAVAATVGSLWSSIASASRTTSTTFTVAGSDVTSTYVDGTPIRGTKGDASFEYYYVVSSSFGGVDTVITVDSAIDATVTTGFARSNILNQQVPKSSGDIRNLILDNNANEMLVFNTTASAVNYFDFTNQSTGQAPTLQVAGDDTNIDFKLFAKGSGVVRIGTANTYFNSSGALTLAGGLSVGDNNITNVGNIALDSISSDASTTITVTLGTDAGDDLLVGNNNTLVVEGDNERVGVGTASPGVKLHVLSTSEVARLETSAGAGNAIYMGFYDSTGSKGFIGYGGSSDQLDFWNEESSDIRLGTANTLRVLIDNSGKVGVGTASPDGTLHAHTATAGAVTANTSADELVIENSADGGMNILTPDASTANIFLGSPTATLGAAMTWNYSNTRMYLGTAVAGGELRINRGASALALYINGDGDIATGGELAPDVDPGGICVNHGANDGYAFTIKNSDVGHTMTGGWEADTYLAMSKRGNTTGGANIFGVAESTTPGLSLYGALTTEDTTDTTSSYGAIEIYGGKDNTSGGVANIGATGNLLAIGAWDGTKKFLLKGDGSIHATNVTGGQLDGTALDGEDDIGLLRTLEVSRSRGMGIAMSRWDDYVQANDEDLKRVGVLSSEGDFYNIQRMNHLLGGAVWQLNTKLMNFVSGLANMLDVDEKELLALAHTY